MPAPASTASALAQLPGQVEADEQPHAGRTSASSCSTSGSSRATIMRTPSAFGCRPSGLVQRRDLPPRPARKNGSYSTPGRCPSRSNTARKAVAVVRAEIGRRIHAGQQHRDVPAPPACRGWRSGWPPSPSDRAPRSPSLAPSSTIAASAPSASTQSSRARPPAVVSPDTAPSMIVHVVAVRAQGRGELRLEPVVVRQAVAGGQRIRRAPAAGPARPAARGAASSEAAGKPAAIGRLSALPARTPYACRHGCHRRLRLRAPPADPSRPAAARAGQRTCV